MCLKIRCDGESEKFCKFFWTKQGLGVAVAYSSRHGRVDVSGLDGAMSIQPTTATTIC